LQVLLQMALDPELTQPVELGSEAMQLTTVPEWDHCLTLQVTGLTPATTYYYRFSYRTLDGVAQTRVGRTRTAPLETADVAPRFAVVCCQDYGGKYFHALRHVAEQELDFVVHLGDYVYESVGDASFQSTDDARQVRFSAPEEALLVGEGDAQFLAAKSLSNYRDLYKTYRSDPDLQALHERHPMIAIWDDHEFSDDCYGQTANYLDGRADETSPERRAAADEAWFEYMPVDFTTAPASKLDAAAPFPDNFAIYRSFVFGKHLELFMTDLRRFRPDHLVPEDAPPGAVFLTQAELTAELGQLPPDAVPYVNIDSFADGVYRSALADNADTLGITAERLEGLVSAVWINTALSNLSGSKLPEPIDLSDASLELGYAYHCLLKSSEFSRIGSRYVVAVGPFEALAQKRLRETDGDSEILMGRAQRAWFTKAIQASSRTFKVWGSEIAFMSRHIDLSAVALAPPELQKLIAISAEDWDGFPNERRALLKELTKVDNVVILSGDLHCFFAGTPYLDGAPEKRVVELVTGSVSSSTWLDSIRGSLLEDPTLPMNVDLLVDNVGALLADKLARPNPHLAFQELSRNGYSIVEVSATELEATIYTLATKVVATPPEKLKSKLDDLFETTRFRTRIGSAELEQELDGEYRTWSVDEMNFL
jgi:alkaline phosphatase D